jgi:hypothetical protein
VLDMKSGLSASLFALAAIREAAPEAWSRLRARFVCVSDEEVGSPSSRALFASIADRTSAALVFEAGRGLADRREREQRRAQPRLHVEHARTAHHVALAHEALEAHRAREHGVDVPDQRERSIALARRGRRVHAMIGVAPQRVGVACDREPDHRRRVVEDRGRALDVLGLARAARLLDEALEERDLRALEVAHDRSAHLRGESIALGRRHESAIPRVPRH